MLADANDENSIKTKKWIEVKNVYEGNSLSYFQFIKLKGNRQASQNLLVSGSKRDSETQTKSVTLIGFQVSCYEDGFYGLC